MKQLFILFTLVLSASIAGAQNMLPTNWKVKFARENVKANDTVTVYFIGEIPEHQGVYGTQFNCEFGPFPTKVVFDNDGNGYTALDSAKSIGAKPEYDEIFECTPNKFKEHALIKQVIRFKDKNAAISGHIEYQTCTNDMCLQFRMNFEFVGTKVMKVENAK